MSLNLLNVYLSVTDSRLEKIKGNIVFHNLITAAFPSHAFSCQMCSPKKKLCPYICHYDQQGNFIRRRPPWTRLIRAEEDAEEEEREEEENRAVFDQRQPLLVISMEEDGKDRGVKRAEPRGED